MYFTKTITSFVFVCLICSKVLAQPLFQETGQSLGISHYVEGGSGLVVFDYDNDGWDDIYFTGAGTSDKLYRNLQGNGFEDVTATTGLMIVSSLLTQAAIAGDLDNDGYMDLVVAVQDDDLVLLKNLGGNFFLFQDESSIPNDPEWVVPMALADVNNDGFLDLYAGGYIEEWGFLLDPQTSAVVGFDNTGVANKLYLNNGDFTFTDVTDDYGVGDTGCTYGVMFSDYDNDGDLDLFTTNDFGVWSSPSNRLFQNNFPTPTFTDISESTNMDIEIYGMGIAQGDFDKDGDLDYYYTNIDSNFFMVNNGISFSDYAKELGVVSDSSGGLSTTHYGCQFLDANNDSHLDLYVAAGGITTAGYHEIEVLEEDSNRLFLNDGTGHFDDVTHQSGLASVYSARGSASLDYDMDGRVDVVVNHMEWANYSAESELYRNVTPNSGNWLKLKLNGVQSNKDCVGCRATFWMDGLPTLMERTAGSSHASQSTSILHIGMGSNQFVDSIQVRYISGIEETVYQIEANQILELHETVVTEIKQPEQIDKFEFRLVNGGIQVWTVDSPAPSNLRLFDSTGRLIWTNRTQVSSQPVEVFSVKSLEPGFYIMDAANTKAAKSTFVFIKT